VSPWRTSNSSTARFASSIAWFVNAAAPASELAIETRPKILAELIRLFKEVQREETQQLASAPQR
jgi:hypothetical protein